MRLRHLVVAITLAAVPAVTLTLAEPASAQTTTKAEFYVGANVTATKDVAISRTKIAKGTTGKIKKIINNNGKPYKLDLELGGTLYRGVSVDVVRSSFSYPGKS